MTTITELKKLLFSMILKTPIWLVHLAANQSSVMSIPTYGYGYVIMYYYVNMNIIIICRYDHKIFKL